MIYISFYVPFVRFYKNLFSYDKKITEYKSLNIEVEADPIIFCFELTTRIKSSHSGCAIRLGLLGVSVMTEIYDIRHWNHEENRYQTASEHQKEIDDYNDYCEKEKKFQEWLNKS